MNKNKSVGIVIVNWNGKRDTFELIDSIKKINYNNYKIYLVDNNSSDDSQKEFIKKYKKNTDIKLILNTKNEGLAGGYNSGIRKVLADKLDYSFIMNNDMTVERNFLSILVNEAEKDEKIAAVGPRIYYYDDKDMVWSTGIKFRLMGFKNSDQNKLDSEIQPKNKIVDALDGAYLIKNSVIKKIGLLEEDFFIMQEMTGWCIKAKKHGYFSMIVPKSKIWHKISRSVQNESKLCTYYGERNWLLLLKRTQSKFRYIIALLMHLALFFPRMTYSLTRGKKFYFLTRLKGFVNSFKFK
jgi:GT2 family glycosyltransferase